MPFRQAAISGEEEMGVITFLLHSLGTNALFLGFIKHYMASVSARNQTNGEPTLITCPALRCPLPTWNRTFTSADALLEHARLTRALHPLCATCLRVFKDPAALDQVRDFFLATVRLIHNQTVL